MPISQTTLNNQFNSLDRIDKSVNPTLPFILSGLTKNNTFLSTEGYLDNPIFDSLIPSYFDSILLSSAYLKIKDYETKFNKSSDEILDLWKNNEVNSPYIYDWVQLYKNFKNL